MWKIGGPATAYNHGAESGGKSIFWPRIGKEPKCVLGMVVVDITTTVNKGRMGGPMSGLFL